MLNDLGDPNGQWNYGYKFQLAECSVDFAVKALWFELLVTNTSRIESERDHSFGPSW